MNDNKQTREVAYQAMLQNTQRGQRLEQHGNRQVIKTAVDYCYDKRHRKDATAKSGNSTSEINMLATKNQQRSGCSLVH